MTHIKITILIYSFFLISCQQQKTKRINEKWDNINLYIGNQLYIFNSQSDSMIQKKWEIKDSLIDNQYSVPIKKNILKKKYYLTSSQKDTIANLVYIIITKPVLVDVEVTCSAGNIELYFKSGNTELQCNYFSVGDWREISKELKLLDYNLKKVLGD